MAELNRANRQVCNVDIRILKTKAPFLFFDTANSTTASLSGDSVYAMAKGARAIAFQNPIQGTIKIDAQVVPFKFYSLLSDGTIESTGIQAVKKTIKAAAAGKLAIDAGTDEVEEGTVFVYKVGEFGEKAIEGTFASGEFTAKTSGDIAANTEYEVGYIVNRKSGVRKISFNNKKLPKDYIITMNTVDKDEDGVLTPFIMTAYKASIQRNFELNFSSEGDPASVSITFDLLEDKEGNVLDMLEDTSAAE